MPADTAARPAQDRDRIDRAIEHASWLGAFAMFAYGAALSFDMLHTIAHAAGLSPLLAWLWGARLRDLHGRRRRRGAGRATRPTTQDPSLSKGDRAVVIGWLKSRSWETPEGDKRSVVEVEADEVAPPSLRWATAKPQRAGNGKGGEFNDDAPF